MKQGVYFCRLIRRIKFRLGQESELPKLHGKVVILSDPGTSPASTTLPRKDPAQAAHAQLQVLLGSAVTFPLAGA